MIDPARLYSALLNTGLQSRDNALYQVIHDLIANLVLVSKQTNTVISGGSSTSVVNNNNTQFLNSVSDSEIPGEDGRPGVQGIQGIQGPQGIPGLDGVDGEDSIFLLR